MINAELQLPSYPFLRKVSNSSSLTMMFGVHSLLFTSALCACFVATAEAFVPNRITTPFRSNPRTAMAVETSDFGTAMPVASSYLEQLGIEEGKLALGIEAADVYRYIGTRESLIARTLEDISIFDRPKAEVEVDKFLMDAEMINLYIRFQKAKEEDPDFSVADNEKADESFFSIRNVFILYIGYIGTSTAQSLFKTYVGEQQAAGLWEGTNIPFVDAWLEKSVTVVDAVQSSFFL